MLCAGAGCTSDAEHVPSRPDPLTARMLNDSRQALRQGDFPAALMLADSAAHRMPRFAYAHFQHGRALSALKQFEEAQAAYQKALALKPDYTTAWLNLGNNASRQLQYRRALDFYRKAQETHPVTAGVFIGRTYAMLGRADSARQAYEQAIAIDSTNAAAYAWLSLLHESQGELEEALKHSRRASHLEPRNADYQYAVGSQLVRIGQPEEAVEHLKAVVERRPWHDGAYYNLGKALARMGRRDEAKRFLAKADSLQRLQTEITRLQKMTRKEPGRSVHWARLGARLRQAGRLEEASRAYKIAGFTKFYSNPE